MHIKTKHTLQNAISLKSFAVLMLFLLLGSCKSLFLDKQQMAAFKVLDKLNYPYQEIVNEDASKSLEGFLTENEISILENWRNSAPILENFLQSECAGCSRSTENLKPVYKTEKGKFIHFGLKGDMGVENLVFKKNGRFVIRFYTFQGEPKEKINEELKDIQNIDYVLEGVYPSAIHTNNVSMQYVAYANHTDTGNQWYETTYPTKIGYAIDLKPRSPILKFKFDGGLYSYQRLNDNGEYQIVNFVEPIFYENAVAIDEPQIYYSSIDAFYANATFFLLNLDEETEVSIYLESNIEGIDFRFSTFENETFYTLEEYLQKNRVLTDQYQNKLSKGSYLIRVLHANADYSEKPLYTIKINRANVH